MSACTEPVRTGIGAGCVEYGRPKWPITMLNHTRVQKNVSFFYFWHPMLVRPAMKRLFCLKAKNGLGRFPLSALPHYNQTTSTAVNEDPICCFRSLCQSWWVPDTYTTSEIENEYPTFVLFTATFGTCYLYNQTTSTAVNEDPTCSSRLLCQPWWVPDTYTTSDIENEYLTCCFCLRQPSVLATYTTRLRVLL